MLAGLEMLKKFWLQCDIWRSIYELNYISVILVGTIMGHSTSMHQLKDVMEYTMFSYQENVKNPNLTESQIIITHSWDDIQKNVM